MAWRAAKSLLTLHSQLKQEAPEAAPPATGADEWGLVGDAAHDPTSDHTPHNFPGWGDQIVTAADFPNRPDLGLDAHKVLDAIRRSQDPRAKYGISNGQIFSNHKVTEHGHTYEAWQWRPYLTASGAKPKDGHYTHGHLSVVGNATADGTQPWHTSDGAAVGEDDEMGASFGPIQLGKDHTSLTIPPVEAGIADPRKVWLNVGGDFFEAGPVGLRIWATNGDGKWFAVNYNGTKQGLHVLHSGVVLAIPLPKGLRILSIARFAVDAFGEAVAPTEALPAFDGSISVCFERQ